MGGKCAAFSEADLLQVEVICANLRSAEFSWKSNANQGAQLGPMDNWVQLFVCASKAQHRQSLANSANSARPTARLYFSPSCSSNRKANKRRPEPLFGRTLASGLPSGTLARPKGHTEEAHNSHSLSPLQLQFGGPNLGHFSHAPLHQWFLFYFHL